MDIFQKQVLSLQQQLQQQLQQLGLGAGNPLLPNFGMRRELHLADPLLGLHQYWKSKVIEVHCIWNEVTESVDVDKLDKRNLLAEKKFEGHKMPTFKLGKRVRIVAEDKRLFKILHKKMGIWKEGLAELIGKEAIVMNLSSRFAIGVALIDNGEMAQIHGFSLELVENQAEGGIWQNKTEFKRDDEVIIGVDQGVLANLQMNARKTPPSIASQLVGLIGRVMGVFRGEVVVTFDEIRHEMFNPAALKRYSDQANGNKKKLTKQPTAKDIQIGTKVTVNAKLSDVMRMQRGHGEWNYKLTKFVGKDGTVVENVQGGDVIVMFNSFESYLMNRQALSIVQKKKRARTKSENEIILDSLTPFAVGDIVRLNVDPGDLMSNMHLLRIPNDFVTIISDCMEFVGYVDQARGVVDMGDGVEFILELRFLAKVGQLIAEGYRKQRQRDKEIGIGKEVVLFIGPKNFVKACIDRSEYRVGFLKALDETAKVEGYDESGNAIIRYADGRLYKLPDEYLCSPRELWKTGDGKQVGFLDWSKKPKIELPCVVSALENMILHSITEVLKANGESEVLGWTSTIVKAGGSENVKTLEIKFSSRVKDSGKFIERLKSKLATEKLRCEYQDTELIILGNGFVYKAAKVVPTEYWPLWRDGPCRWLILKDFIRVGRMMFVGMEEGTQDDVTTGTPEQSGSTTNVSFQDSAPSTPMSLGRSLSVNEVMSEPENPGIAAAPFGANSVNIPIPQGVNQIVLQLGRSVQPSPTQNTIPRAPTSDTAPPTGVIMNPTAPTIINMYGDGENKVNIDKSYVRAIQQK